MASAKAIPLLTPICATLSLLITFLISAHAGEVRYVKPENETECYGLSPCFFKCYYPWNAFHLMASQDASNLYTIVQPQEVVTLWSDVEVFVTRIEIFNWQNLSFIA